MDTLLLWDKNLFLWLNNLGTPQFDALWMAITDKKHTIGFYVVIIAICSRWLGWKKTLWLLLTIALLITFTDQITNAIKNGFQRFRPCHEEAFDGLMRRVKSSCGGKYSYFSGHASNSFAIATLFVTLFAKRFQAMHLLFVVAAFVAYSRIYIGVHYPLDVLSGALFGAFGGWLFAKIYLKFIPNPL